MNLPTRVPTWLIFYRTESGGLSKTWVRGVDQRTARAAFKESHPGLKIVRMWREI